MRCVRRLVTLGLVRADSPQPGRIEGVEGPQFTSPDVEASSQSYISQCGSPFNLLVVRFPKSKQLFSHSPRSSPWKQLAESVASRLLIRGCMRNPMEFVRNQMSSFAGLSPSMENGGKVAMPTRTQGLHSRFNPKLVGFGIVSPFEPSLGTPAALSPDAAIRTSYAAKPTEILK
jgi:hypothetical protein